MTKEVLIYCILLLVFYILGFATCFTIWMIIKSKNKKTVEEIKNEIEKTDASDLVNSSPNNDDIRTTIDNEKSDLRERIKHRFE